MEQRLKQRLIGAAVLVALAVIFLPMFLTGPVERHSMDVPIEIPPRPQLAEAPALPQVAELKTVSERQPTPTPVFSERQREPAPPQEPAPAQRAPAVQMPAAVEPPPAPAETPAPSPELAAWAVQVGSFGSQNNALRLRDALREAGFTAYVETPAGDTRFYRVRVGPVVQRDEAQVLLTRLEQEQSLSGLVVSHP